MIIGRKEEINLLKGITKDDRSHFVAVYGRRRDGFEQFPCRLVVGRDAECLVESEHADTVAAVEGRNDGEHLFSVGCLFDGSTELLHFFAHALVVNLLLFFHSSE